MSFTVGRAAVGTTATTICTTVGPVSQSYSVSLKNIGEEVVFVSDSSGVTDAVGYPLNPGETASFVTATSDTIYGITSGGSSSVAWMRGI